MATVMESKIKAAFEEWNQQVNSTESTVMKSSTSKPLATKLLDYITSHPGVTGAQLRKIIRDQEPSTPTTYIPAVLKGLFDTHFVRREMRSHEVGQRGRGTFAYYALTDEARAKAVEEQNQKPKKRKYTKRNTEKVAKADKGITTLVPAKRHAAYALDVGPATVSIAIATSSGTSYSLNIRDAKFIYVQLNQIFGGVR